MAASKVNKTRPTDADVHEFIAGVQPERRRAECATLLALFGRITGMSPQMWGPSIVGYGRYRYRYESGHAGESFLTGFAPRKAAMTVYVMPGFGTYSDLLAQIGPHKHSVSCLYLSNVARNNLELLGEMLADSVKRMKDRYEWWPK